MNMQGEKTTLEILKESNLDEKKHTISIDLGIGWTGSNRLGALREMANGRGLEWNDRPSIGKLITTLADEHIAQRAIERRKKYQLDIYTWPCACGIDPKIRTTHHDTPQDAITHLHSISKPYSHAVLLIRIEGVGNHPCDWDGNKLYSGRKWPRRTGMNYRELHPDLKKLKDDYIFLMDEITRRHAAGERGGTIHIASKLLRERHPDIVGWAGTLANHSFDREQGVEIECALW